MDATSVHSSQASPASVRLLTSPSPCTKHRSARRSKGVVVPSGPLDAYRLLLRFGIAVDVRSGTANGGFPHGWTLEITGRDELRRFLQEIGIDGPADEAP